MKRLYVLLFILLFITALSLLLDIISLPKGKPLTPPNAEYPLGTYIDGENVKLILKTSRLLNFSILFFFDTLEFVNVCGKSYVILGGKLLEYSENREFYHPYSKLLYTQRIALRGCPFHDECSYAKNDKKLYKVCASSFPIKTIIGRNEVYCRLYSLKAL